MTIARHAEVNDKYVISVTGYVPGAELEGGGGGEGGECLCSIII